MKNLFKQLFPIFIIFLFTFFFIRLNFYPYALRYGEEQSLINYDSVNWRYGSLWSGLFNFGNITPYYFATLTLGTFWKIAHFFNFDLVSTQHIFYYICVSLVALFFYLLVLSLTRRRFLSLLLSLIYITTYQFYGFLDTTPKLLQFLILPSFLWCFIKYIHTSKIRYIFLNLFLIISTLGIAINPPQMVASYGLVIAFIVLFYTNRNTWRKIVLFVFPYCITLLFVATADFLVLNNNIRLFGYNPFYIPPWAPSSPIHDILRFFGSWADYGGGDGIVYNHLVNYYHSPLGVTMTYVPAAILFILILAKSTIKKSYRLPVVILFVLFLFLTKGDAPPFNFIYNNVILINLFQIFRDTWGKFITDFIFSVYVGIAILLMEKTKWTYRLTVIVLIAYLFFQAYPALTGKALDHRYIRWKVADVVVPPYWLDINSYSKKYLKDKRILILPASKYMELRLVHNWQPYYFFGYPEQLFINADIVVNAGNDSGEKELMNRYFQNISPSLLFTSSIDYVLFKRDIITNDAYTVGLNSVIGALDIDKKVTFGQLDLYPVKDRWKSPKIGLIDQFQNTLTPIDFSQINTTTYKVVLPQGNYSELSLLFNDLYNNGWQLYGKNSVWASPIYGVTHYPTANYFNLFIIPKEFVPPDGIVYLRLSHQSTFEKIRAIFITILLVYFFAISVFLLKKSYEKIA